MLRNLEITRNKYLSVPFTHVPYQRAAATSSRARSPCPGASSPRPPLSVPTWHIVYKQGLILQRAPLTKFTFMGSSPRLRD